MVTFDREGQPVDLEVPLIFEPTTVAGCEECEFMSKLVDEPVFCEFHAFVHCEMRDAPISIADGVCEHCKTDHGRNAKRVAEFMQSKSELHVMRDADGKVVHAFATASFPLPSSHWIYQRDPDGFHPAQPPPLFNESARLQPKLRQQLLEAMRWAVQVSTNCGRDTDFDPDALVMNLLTACFGVTGQGAPE
jgi:hypothetical protein